MQTIGESDDEDEDEDSDPENVRPTELNNTGTFQEQASMKASESSKEESKEGSQIRGSSQFDDMNMSEEKKTMVGFDNRDRSSVWNEGMDEGKNTITAGQADGTEEEKE